MLPLLARIAPLALAYDAVIVCAPVLRVDVVKLACPPDDTAVGPARTVDPSRNVTDPSVAASPVLVVTVAVKVTASVVNDGFGDADTVVRVVLTTVTTAVA